jgi:ribosomal protein S18 acetylase RimI-like enzyme
VEIRKAIKQDVHGMVECHKQAFPRQPMTEMGSAWLNYLYSYYLKHPKGVSIVAVDDKGQVVGFAVGGDNAIRGEFIKRATCRYFYLFPMKFFTKAILRKKFVRKLVPKLKSHSLGIIPEDVQEILKKSGVLLSIGVIESCRGTQIASRLIQKFFDVIIQDYETARLTVHADNLRARKFYEKNGWRVIYEDTEEAKYIKSKK